MDPWSLIPLLTLGSIDQPLVKGFSLLNGTPGELLLLPVTLASLPFPCTPRRGPAWLRPPARRLPPMVLRLPPEASMRLANCGLRPRGPPGGVFTGAPVKSSSGLFFLGGVDPLLLAVTKPLLYLKGDGGHHLGRCWPYVALACVPWIWPGPASPGCHPICMITGGAPWF